MEGETLLRLANSSYYGGVFLTDSGSSMLNMLVNREGFVPDQGFEHLRKLLRRGIDLSVRLRASVQAQSESSLGDSSIAVTTRQPNVAKVVGERSNCPSVSQKAVGEISGVRQKSER